MSGIAAQRRPDVMTTGKELRFPIKVKSTERKMEGDAQVKFKTSDFGVKPYSAALGLIRNKDEVELVVHVVIAR